MLKYYFAIVILISVSACMSKKPVTEPLDPDKEIRWMSFTEAVKANQKQPKKVFIDVFTDWCGWCKKMDASTFTHPVIVAYMNKHYYAVKLNAEMKDTIVFNGLTYTSSNPSAPRSTHQLASSLLNGKLSYPTTVYLDENMGMLGPVPGYLDAKTLEAILHFYGDEAYKTTPWADYQSNFAGEVK